MGAAYPFPPRPVRRDRTPAPLGARTAAPRAELGYFEAAENFWRNRTIFDNYNTYNDFFAPTASIPIDRPLDDYATFAWQGIELLALPAPGHTKGGVALVGTIDGRRVAFTGDVIHDRATRGRSSTWSGPMDSKPACRRSATRCGRWPTRSRRGAAVARRAVGATDRGVRAPDRAARGLLPMAPALPIPGRAGLRADAGRHAPSRSRRISGPTPPASPTPTRC